MTEILIINGPNLNLLGVREPGVYGIDTLDKINAELMEECQKLDISPEFFQSNHEGDIIDKLHQARENKNAVILNAGAFTHYSYAIRDAIAAIKIPVVEVHLSNVHAREEFRQKSVIAPVCCGSISGFGKYSYFLALFAVSNIVNSKKGMI